MGDANALALYPFPGMGHLIAMVEFAKLLLTHHPSFSVTIFTSTAPTIDTISTTINAQLTTYIKFVSAVYPSITFHHLPTLPPSSPNLDQFELARLNIPYIHQALQNLSKTSNLNAFIIDIFCNAAFGVAKDLNIPIFYFYTSAASCLGFLLNLPNNDQNHRFTDHLAEDVVISIPGLPPMPLSLLFDGKDNSLHKSFLDTATHMTQSNGIIVNTFELLESKAIKALRDGKCLPDQPTPPIFCTGPLISAKSGRQAIHQTDGVHEYCLKWLKAQPKQSVVFLCFGSMGVFSGEQLKEMALGLEKSGHRFLWVVRNPPENDDHLELSLDEILPSGFLERTRERALVVRQWAPQVEVLSYDSVGGFVTHCGWNSVLESVSAGVPMVGWPLYAEQRINRVFLVETMKVGLAVNESENGFVSADDLKKRVTELMDSESERGREVRERALELKNGAVAAKEEGGSSIADLAKLAELWNQT